MKKGLFLSMLCFSLTTQAQGVWETPTEAGQKAEATQSEVAKVEVKDAKYLAGAVPEENGEVVWRHEIVSPGHTAQQLYDALLGRLNELTQGENQLEGSKVALVNKAEYKIAAAVKEWMVFQSTFLSLDRAKFNYTIQVECHDGKANIELGRIRYFYEMVRNKSEVLKAEEWITDKYAMNKKGTKLYRVSGKFRRKTVDRVEEIFQLLDNTCRMIGTTE